MERELNDWKTKYNYDINELNTKYTNELNDWKSRYATDKANWENEMRKLRELLDAKIKEFDDYKINSGRSSEGAMRDLENRYRDLESRLNKEID